MYLISVTLDVSKLSGWLKTYADCRVDKEGRAMRGEVRAAGGGRAWGGRAAAQAACTGKARLKAWGPGHAQNARKTSRSCP
jgi:hypothetical protein